MPVTRATDGVELSYQIVGTGPTSVLFMHGWAGSGAYFDSTIECLDTAQVRAITYDLRGHGRSGRTDDGYHLDQLADDAITVADAADADLFVLVGFSMSGKFAQYVTNFNPNRVLGQILVAGSPVEEIPLPPELLADWYGRAGDADRLIEITQMFSTQPVPQEVLRRFGDDAAAIPLSALKGTIEAVTTTSFVIKTTTVPTTVVGGEHDAMFAPDFLRDVMVDKYRRAELLLLDCGHEIPIERPRELAQIIQSFVEHLPSRSHELHTWA